MVNLALPMVTLSFGDGGGSCGSCSGDGANDGLVFSVCVCLYWRGVGACVTTRHRR